MNPRAWMLGASRRALPATAATILVLHALHAWRTWADDAFISFRYLQNLVAGRGMVFNPGERLEGLTNLGWALLLAPFGGGDLLLASKVLGLGFGVATVFLVDRWCLDQGLGLAGRVAALATLVLVPWLPFWCVQGMETPAAAFFVTLAWSRFARARGGGPGVALGLAAAPWFRPETALLPALLALWQLAGRRPRWPRGATLTALPVLVSGALLVALKLAWFGAILPNTFHVKVGGWPPDRGLAYLRAFATLPAPWLPALVAVALAVGLARALRRRDAALPSLVALLLVAVGVALDGDFMANFRLFVPAWPAACAALGALAGPLTGGWRLVPGAIVLGAAVAPQARVLSLDEADQPRPAEPIPKTAPLLWPWSSATFGSEWQSQSDWPTAWALVHAGPGDAVAFTDVGFFGYAHDGVVIDLLGLTDATMAGRGGERWAEQWAYLRGRAAWAVLDTRSGQWKRYRDAFAEAGWEPVAACGADWAMANPSLPGGAPTEAEMGRRVDRLLRVAPRAVGLQVAVARELAQTGGPHDLLAALYAHTATTWLSAAEARRLACELGLEAGCTVEAVMCGPAATRPDLADLADPETWPLGWSLGEGPQDPERKVRPDGGVGLPQDQAEACREAIASARAAWVQASDTWGRHPEHGELRHLSRRAANRSGATPDDAVVAARLARDVARERAPGHPALAHGEAAWEASLEAYRLCREPLP